MLEIGRLKFAFRLANEMIDLVGRDAIDLELDYRHTARTDRDFALAAQREQAAIPLDFNFLREFGSGNDAEKSSKVRCR